MSLTPSVLKRRVLIKGKVNQRPDDQALRKRRHRGMFCSARKGAANPWVCTCVWAHVARL
eukprot:6303411-Prymnesium_polylepis.2